MVLTVLVAVIVAKNQPMGQIQKLSQTMNLRLIAQQLNLDYDSIRRWLKKNRIVVHKPNQRPLLLSRQTQIQARIQSGESAESIAKDLQVNLSSLTKFLREKGIRYGIWLKLD